MPALRLTEKEAKVARLLMQLGAGEAVEEYDCGDKFTYHYPFDLTAKEWDSTIDKIGHLIRRAEIDGIRF